MSKNNLAVSIRDGIRLNRDVLAQLDLAMAFLGESVEEIELSASLTGFPTIQRIDHRRALVEVRVRSEVSDA